MFQQTLARTGEQHAVGPAFKQGNLEFVLQCFDLGGDRRLAHVQGLPRTGELTEFGDGGEGPQLINFYGNYPLVIEPLQSNIVRRNNELRKV